MPQKGQDIYLRIESTPEAPQPPSSEDLAKQFGGELATPDLAKQFGGEAVETPQAPPSTYQAPQTLGEDLTHFGYGAIVEPVKGLMDLAGSIYNKGLFGTAGAVAHGIGASHQAEYDKAKEALKSGNYGQAAAHAAAYLVPVLGPQVGSIVEEAARTGDWALANGRLTSILVPAGQGISNATTNAVVKSSIDVPGLFRNPNAAERSAVAFGQQQGIPIDAATATGSKLVRGTQYLADRSIGGGLISEGTAQAQADALKNVGGKLASQVAAQPSTAVEAGEAIQQAVAKSAARLHEWTTKAYDSLRQMEQDPANIKTVQTGTKQVNTGVLGVDGQPIIHTVPVTEQMALPVDLRAAKSALKPIYDRMRRQMAVTQQMSNPGLKAIENIVNGPDFAPASVADMDLSAIKGISRGADSPVTRDISQGLASQAVRELHDAVDAAVAQAGPKATQALRLGRETTRAKYLVSEVLDSLNQEPARIVGRVTAPKDAGIASLRELAKIAPQELPKIGRAYLDDLLSTATAEGGFGKTGTISNRWQNLGPETKRLLFRDPALIKDLDDFFLLAKKAAENPNPSGTGHIVSLGAQGAMLVTNPLTGVPVELGAAGLSKLLHSRAGVRALTEGFTIPYGRSAAALRVAALIGRLAQSQEQP